MKIQELKKQIKGVFVQPVVKYYFGKVAYGTPYFYPKNYNGSIIRIRKLIKKSNTLIEEYNNRYPYLKNDKRSIYTNVPMVCKDVEFFVKLFGNTYYITLGYPIVIHKGQLGWKDKFDSPRFEWAPSFHIYFFGLQFCKFWVSPDLDNDNYYEMILWYLKYSKKDIKKAEETWGWVNSNTKLSTWNKDYLLKNNKI